jgi:DNA-binding SARP family transcriptional activator
LTELPRTTTRFSILGPLSYEPAEGSRSLGPLKQRLLLGMLLCRPNALVSPGLLTDTLWDGNPPRTARKNIQVYVSALRKLLDLTGDGDRLVHQAGGYLLRVGDDDLDALRFRYLVRAAREATGNGAHVPASRMLREALALWRGPSLHDLRFSPTLQAEARRLDFRYLQAYEDWAEAELRLGDANEVADTVSELVERHPERERLRAAQMNALFKQGRQTEALAAYEGLRQTLASEYGLQPSPPLEALYQSMLSSGWPDPGGPTASTGPGAPGGPVDALGTLLPQDLPDFTGRRAQLRSILSLFEGEEIRRQPLAVLTGPVGTGKSALAVHAAHRLADAFPDGRVLVHMRDEAEAPRSHRSVLTALNRQVGLPAPRDPDAWDLEGAASAWRGWLAHHSVLLVLDDAAAESGVRPLLPDTGASAVLVTARTRLAGLASAHRVEMTPFDQDESLELLGAIVGDDRLDPCREEAERIVASTGMLPLAVRVCGLALAVRRHLPLGEYAERLADNRNVLDELVAGDMNVRPRLASGWRDLSTSGKSALCMLGALPQESFTLSQAAGALHCGPDAARRTVESLMDAGAILAPDDQVASRAAVYELPRLLHVYAREQAAGRRSPATRATA